MPGAHLETIVPSLTNRVEGIQYDRERLELPEGDFLDLDWLKGENKKLLVISHGFGGNSHRHYVKRPAKYFHDKGWDILAWNNRGCSGEINRLMKFHHHGDTDDLSSVIDHALKKDTYDRIVILGISMGGCQAVKYFGERSIDDRVLGAFTVSVSCDLRETNDAVDSQLHGLYSRRFLGNFLNEFKEKSQFHSDLASIDFDSIKTFDDFHREITTRVYGFDSLLDYYEKSSCNNYINGIDKPVFILNANNDPLLGPKCYPTTEAENHEYVHLEIPRYGGHVGFTLAGSKESYIEVRAEKFINEVLKT